MLKTSLHIITSKIPDRYAYNGAEDIYWKILAFQKAGISCKLHIINRPSAIPNEIRANCNNIHFYERTKGHATFSFKAPFRVIALFNRTLLNRLLEDDYPIFFDQIDTTYYLRTPAISSRLHFIQIGKSYFEFKQPTIATNNSLSIKILNLYKSFVYRFYSQKVLEKAWLICHSLNNIEHYRGVNKLKLIQILPFIGLPIFKNIKGKGNYCLFHGDFKDPKTMQFGLWLLDTIFKEIDIPLVIAGKNTTNKLETAAHKQLHTCMVADPTETEMNELISKSQICIHLISSNQEFDYATILSMQYGRHILKIHESDLMVETDNHKKVMNNIIQLFEREFDLKDMEKREEELNFLSQDIPSAQKIKEIIDGHYQ